MDKVEHIHLCLCWQQPNCTRALQTLPFISMLIAAELYQSIIDLSIHNQLSSMLIAAELYHIIIMLYQSTTDPSSCQHQPAGREKTQGSRQESKSGPSALAAGALTTLSYCPQAISLQPDHFTPALRVPHTQTDAQEGTGIFKLPSIYRTPTPVKHDTGQLYSSSQAQPNNYEWGLNKIPFKNIIITSSKLLIHYCSYTRWLCKYVDGWVDSVHSVYRQFIRLLQFNYPLLLTKLAQYSCQLN